MKYWLALVYFLMIGSSPGSEKITFEGLFLTWQRDPSSTMTLQWMERGEPLPLVPRRRVTPAAPFDIPRLERSALDERMAAALWRDGFSVDLLTDHGQRFFDFSASGRIAWTEEGVAFGVEVRQVKFREASDNQPLWKGDSVELVLAHQGGPPLHVAMAPGLDPLHPAARGVVIHPGGKEQPLVPHVWRADAGYRLWVLIPWETMGIASLGRGALLDLQIYLNQRQPPVPSRRLAWFPYWNQESQTKPAYTVCLADRASPPFRAVAGVSRLPGVRSLICTVDATPACDGLSVEVSHDGMPVGVGVLRVEPGSQTSRAVVTLDGPPEGGRWEVLDVHLSGGQTFQIPVGMTSVDCRPVAAVDLFYRKKGEAEARVMTTSVKALETLPGYFLHRVELTGLDADSLYSFYLEEKGSHYSFRTMPAKLNRPIAIAMGGDTLHDREWMESTNRVAVGYDPDFVIWGGDLADANGQRENHHRWHDWFSAIRSGLVTEEGRVVPIVVALGNHDVKKGYHDQHPGYEATDEWRSRLAPEFYELFAFPGQPGYGVLDFGDYCSVLILDSDHTNAVEGAQTGWLEKTLEERRNVRYLLPIYHVGAYPSVKKFEGRTEQNVRKHWPPLFEKYKIRFAFEHHNHAYKRTHPIRNGRIDASGVVYVGDGAWGVAPREPYSATDTWYLEKSSNSRHLMLLTLEGKGQSIQVLNSKGEIIDVACCTEGE